MKYQGGGAWADEKRERDLLNLDRRILKQL